MEELGFLSTLILVLVGLFLLYKTGIMRLTQAATDAAVRQSGKALEEWELSGDESRSASYGKLEARLKDKTVARSSASSIRAQLETLEVKTAA